MLKGHKIRHNFLLNIRIYQGFRIIFKTMSNKLLII
jgi:hypothetical protein